MPYFTDRATGTPLAKKKPRPEASFADHEAAKDKPPKPAQGKAPKGKQSDALDSPMTNPFFKHKKG